MKFNFKKIASVLAATIMLGSTVSFAAAAWPAPFVQDGSSASAVVYGANAPSTGGDKAAAINLGAELDKSITAVSSSGTTSGDVIKLSKSTNFFNLGEIASDFYSTLDEEQLSKVLASGVYANDANDEFDYEQSINMGALNLTHFLDSDFNDNKPIIGFDLADGTHILNYTLEFTDAADNVVVFGAGTSTAGDELETTLLPMLGMTYYIQKVENTTTGTKLTLLDNANDASVTEGEDKTVTVGDNSYNVKVNFIDSASTILEVNGVKTNKLTEGGVFKIATDTYVAVKSILYNAKESGISSVEFSIGSGKITLDNGKEVQLNGEDISETTNQVLTAYITASSDDTQIEKIVLSWDLDDDMWLAPGSDLVLPGFETIKVSMAAFNQPKAEKTTIKEDGDTKLALWTTIKDGDIKLPLLYNNASGILGLGEKSTHKLVTNATGGLVTTTATNVFLNETLNNFFVVTWISGKDFESYVYELNGITDSTGKNETTLKNLAGGSDIVFSEVGKDKDRGNVNFKLSEAHDNAKYAKINLTVSSGAIYIDRIVTKEGMQILLPQDNSTGTSDPNKLNFTLGQESTSWTTNVTEEDRDGNIAAGKRFTVKVAPSTDGMEATVLGESLVGTTDTFETYDGSDVYEGYVESPLATKVVWDKPTSGANTLDIIYAGEESSADVYIAESAAAVGAVKDSVKVVTDAEVDSVKSKNLIVVGGSCINTVAASMLGSTSPVCGDSWASQTGTGPGQYLIQVAASPVNAEKIAMLIAGYETADTQNAVAKVKEGAVSTDVGTKIVGPVAA